MDWVTTSKEEELDDSLVLSVGFESELVDVGPSVVDDDESEVVLESEVDVGSLDEDDESDVEVGLSEVVEVASDDDEEEEEVDCEELESEVVASSPPVGLADSRGINALLSIPSPPATTMAKSREAKKRKKATAGVDRIVLGFCLERNKNTQAIDKKTG